MMTFVLPFICRNAHERGVDASGPVAVTLTDALTSQILCCFGYQVHWTDCISHVYSGDKIADNILAQTVNVLSIPGSGLFWRRRRWSTASQLNELGIIYEEVFEKG